MYTIVAAFFITLMVAVGNLALGYAVALYLGRGPKPISALRPSVAKPARAPAPADESPRAATAPPRSHPAEAADPDSPAEQVDTPPDEAPTEVHNPAEEACRLTTKAMELFNSDLGRLEGELRRATQDASGEKLGTCAADLNHAVRRCLRQLNAAVASASQGSLGASDGNAPCTQVQKIVESLAAQANAALADLVGIQFSGDEMADAGDRVYRAHEAIVLACHERRDEFDDSLLELLRTERDDAQRDPTGLVDSHSSLAARLLLERTLAQWWSADAPAGGEHTMAMFDINWLGRVNRQFGLATGERLLSEVFNLVRAAADGEVAARVAGQQFYVLCQDRSLTSLAEMSERLRQTVEKTRFVREETEVRITLSTAVAAVQSGDSGAVVLERLRAALGEAKRYGRNRTVLCEDECPTPVVPPELDISERTVRL